MTTTQKIITSAIVVLVLLGAYIAIDRIRKSAPSTTNTNTQTNATTTNGLGIQASGDYKIEQVPVNEGRNVPQPIPDLTRAVTPVGSAKVSPDATTLASKNIPMLQITLKTHPDDISSWIALGTAQKMAGDYQGSVISWDYASRLVPSDYVSLGNLGNLYAYFLNDKVKAETYYKRAIVNGPKQPYLYIQLGQVYRDLFKDVAKAKATADQGLAQVPNDATLLQFKATMN